MQQTIERSRIMANQRNKTQSGFTLIELLAVMLLMAIITGITIVGFTGVTRGAAASGAARNLQQTIKLARQYAITQRIPVAFIIADQDLLTANGLIATAESSNLISRAYAVYDLRHFKYLKAWTELPQTMVFMNGTLDELTGGMAGEGRHVLDLPRNIEQDIPFPYEHSPTYARFHGIIFGPDGKLLNTGGGWYFWVMAFEGGVDNDLIPFRRGAGRDIVYGIRVSYSGAAQMIELTMEL